MSKIFKPRRGKASTMNGTKSSTVLAAGEMFIELPDTGVGTGTCKMKMGDGVTAYGSLPYAMGGDIATTEITGGINDDTSSTATAALANVTTGKTLGSIIGSLRRACSLNAEAIATLNDDYDSIDKPGTTALNGNYTNTNASLNLVCLKYKRIGICHFKLHTGSNIASYSSSPNISIFQFPTGYIPGLAGRVYLAPSADSYSVMGFYDDSGFFAREQYQPNKMYYGSFCYLIN